MIDGGAEALLRVGVPRGVAEGGSLGCDVGGGVPTAWRSSASSSTTARGSTWAFTFCTAEARRRFGWQSNKALKSAVAEAAMVAACRRVALTAWTGGA